MEDEKSDNVDSAEKIDNNNNSSLRESFVNTAVKFLQNPKVSSSPFKQKQEFLKSKGLTSDEIKKAFHLASKVIPTENQFEISTIANSPNHIKPSNSSTLLYKLKEFFSATTFIGTTIYCVYWFYKKFIKPFIFAGKKNDKKTENFDNNELTQSITEMRQSIVKMEDSVNKLVCNNLPDPSISNLVQELKQDLVSLKGLLLSRKQFPSAPPSIPPWQMETPSQSREKTTEREDDAASGSSTNNSDSSLEMIREEPPK